MENKIEKAIDKFVDVTQTEEVKPKSKTNSRTNSILSERDGLVERVDRVMVVRDGRELLHG